MCFEWGSGIEIRREESCTGRDFWLEDWEKQAIIAFHLKNPAEGYRRLTFMMLDADIVAVQSGQGVACAESGGATAKMEREAIKERDWL
jgi:hypothetical protein